MLKFSEYEELLKDWDQIRSDAKKVIAVIGHDIPLTFQKTNSSNRSAIKEVQ